MVSFVDRAGIACHETFFRLWPKSKQIDEVMLAALLNSPIANAFVATRQGNRDITAEVVRLTPLLSRTQHTR
jgi:hypothetical protein